MEKDIRICQCCNKEVERKDMEFTRDCHGITFRLVCFDCYEKLMAKGYDDSITRKLMNVLMKIINTDRRIVLRH